MSRLHICWTLNRKVSIFKCCHTHFLVLYSNQWCLSIHNSNSWALTHPVSQKESEKLKKKHSKPDFLDMVPWYSGYMLLLSCIGTWPLSIICWISSLILIYLLINVGHLLIYLRRCLTCWCRWLCLLGVLICVWCRYIDRSIYFVPFLVFLGPLLFTYQTWQKCQALMYPRNVCFSCSKWSCSFLFFCIYLLRKILIYLILLGLLHYLTMQSQYTGDFILWFHAKFGLLLDVHFQNLGCNEQSWRCS